MTSVSSTNARRHAGFSLIELMVGIVVGMIGLLVIYKTLSVWDTHSRTTTAGGDAQVAGTLAMYNLERDIKVGGLGFAYAASSVMGCTVTGSDAGRALSFRLHPVEIAVGDNDGPDTITVLAGSSAFFETSQTFTASTATTKKLVIRSGFRNGDVALVAGNAAATTAGSATCQLVQITDNTDLDGFTVSHAATSSYQLDPAYAAASTAASRYNDAAGTGTTFTTGTIFNLGPVPTHNVWTVDASANVLKRTNDIDGPASYEISQGVIGMKALYGIDSGTDNIISDSEWVATTPTDWTKVRAIRVSLLVRSSQFEKPESGTAAPTPTSANPTWGVAIDRHKFLMKNIDGGTDSFADNQVDPNNWRYYRYRVYEKVIPLRNMVWGTAPYDTP